MGSIVDWFTKWFSAVSYCAMGLSPATLFAYLKLVWQWDFSPTILLTFWALGSCRGLCLDMVYLVKHLLADDFPYGIPSTYQVLKVTVSFYPLWYFDKYWSLFVPCTGTFLPNPMATQDIIHGNCDTTNIKIITNINYTNIVQKIFDIIGL